VWAWGANAAGQLGDGSYHPSGAPVQVLGLGGVKAIAAGVYHGLALTGDGTVWAWGSNVYGELGNGADLGSPQPVQVGGLHGVVAIVAGGVHSLAIQAPPILVRTESGAGGMAYSGKWIERRAGVASGGSAMHSDPTQPGEASLQWQGTDLVVLMVRGPQMGMAWITVDEQDDQLVDLYAPTLQYQQVALQVRGLPPGPHVVTIAPSGQRNSYSSGTAIALDAIDTR
jgi:hypothetical protein